MPTSPMYRVRTEWSGLPGGAALTTMHYAVSSGSAQQAVTAMGAFWTGLASRIANDAAWRVDPAVAVVDPVSGFVTSYQSTSPVSGAGTAADAMLSLGTNGLINLHTGVFNAGREIRGKLYVLAPTVGQNLDGVPSVPYANALLAAWDTLWNATGVAPVVYSAKSGSWEDVEARNVSPYWARLRSRQR